MCPYRGHARERLTKEGNHRKASVLELCLLQLEGPGGVL